MSDLSSSHARRFIAMLAIAIALVSCSSRRPRRTAYPPAYPAYPSPYPAYPSGYVGYPPPSSGLPPPMAPMGPQPPPTPSYVHVAIENALIGPTKSNRCQWDGMTCGAGGTGDIVNGISAALSSSNPYFAAGNVLAGPLSQAIEKPDPMGIAEIYNEGQFQSLALQKRQDTFTPQWNVRFFHVRLEPATRLSIRFQDADLELHDDMGAFDIGYAHLLAALNGQRTHEIPVHQETFRQVLFVGISVVPAT